MTKTTVKSIRMDTMNKMLDLFEQAAKLREQGRITKAALYEHAAKHLDKASNELAAAVSLIDTLS